MKEEGLEFFENYFRVILEIGGDNDTAQKVLSLFFWLG